MKTAPRDDNRPSVQHERRVDMFRLQALLDESQRMLSAGELDENPMVVRHINRTLAPILTRRMQFLARQQYRRCHPSPGHDVRRLTDQLLTVLRGAKREMSIGELFDATSRNHHAKDIRAALRILQTSELASVRHVRRFAKKRPAEVWQAEVRDFVPPPASPAPQYVSSMIRRAYPPPPPKPSARWT